MNTDAVRLYVTTVRPSVLSAEVCASRLTEACDLIDELRKQIPPPGSPPQPLDATESEPIKRPKLSLINELTQAHAERDAARGHLRQIKEANDKIYAELAQVRAELAAEKKRCESLLGPGGRDYVTNVESEAQDYADALNTMAEELSSLKDSLVGAGLVIDSIRRTGLSVIRREV